MTMKKHWLLNIALLLIVAGLVAFLHLRPKPPSEASSQHEISSLKLGGFSKISVEFPSKAPIVYEKNDNYWYIMQPYKARADQMAVQRILSIVAATSKERFPISELAKFGLDSPRLKLKLDNEEFLFGTYNPVSEQQYVAYKDAIYLLDKGYSEYASIQTVEMIDKNPLGPKEKIAGFDFSRLEQWESSRLNLDLENGTWRVSVPEAKPVQKDINEWLEISWKQINVAAVEPYTPDRRVTYPSFEIKLQDGRKVHFDKLMESPELLLGRPDEGMQYHIPPDIGFAMLNPPVGVKKD